jgi:hypothetical protein
MYGLSGLVNNFYEERISSSLKVEEIHSSKTETSCKTTGNHNKTTVHICMAIITINLIDTGSCMLKRNDFPLLGHLHSL